MIVGMNDILTQFAPQQLGCTIGDHLVGIHVMTGAGPGLEGIDDKLIVPFSIDDLLRCICYRFGCLLVE